MKQSAAQWARGQIQAGVDENNLVTVALNGTQTQMPLWYMAEGADISDRLDEQAKKLFPST